MMWVHKEPRYVVASVSPKTQDCAVLFHYEYLGIMKQTNALLILFEWNQSPEIYGTPHFVRF